MEGVRSCKYLDVVGHWDGYGMMGGGLLSHIPRHCCGDVRRARVCILFMSREWNGMRYLEVTHSIHPPPDSLR